MKQRSTEGREEEIIHFANFKWFELDSVHLLFHSGLPVSLCKNYYFYIAELIRKLIIAGSWITALKWNSLTHLPVAVSTILSNLLKLYRVCKSSHFNHLLCLSLINIPNEATCFLDGDFINLCLTVLLCGIKKVMFTNNIVNLVYWDRYCNVLLKYTSRE